MVWMVVIYHPVGVKLQENISDLPRAKITVVSSGNPALLWLGTFGKGMVPSRTAETELRKRFQTLH